MKDFSYGSRGIIGLIYPSPGWVMEPEFYKMSPEGVITCTTRISLFETNTEQLVKIRKYAIEATELISQAPVDVIALGCTSGSFIGGMKYDLELTKEMEKVSKGVPCTTTSSSVVSALRTLGVKKIAVITPYIEEVNKRAKIFLEENNFEITKILGLGLLYDSQIDNQSLKTVYRLARDVDTNDTEAIVILCTGLRSIGILDFLERDLNKPVISAIQSTFWNCLRTCGVMDKIDSYGTLLKNF